jgi:hypothetical protein
MARALELSRGAFVEVGRWWVGWWGDRDRRRAALLSSALHLLVLFFAVWMLRPQVHQAPPTYLVIDIGTPALAEETVEAPTAEEAAAQTESPQVEDIEIGQPQAAAAPEPEPATPDPTTQTAQPPTPAPAPAAPELAETAPAPPLPEPALPAPAPEVPLAAVPTTPLPEIDIPEIEPAPLTQRVPVPAPAVAVVVPEVRAIAPTPQVTVAAAEAVPQPNVRASVAEAAPVPTPQVSTAVASARPVAVPAVQAATTPGRDVGVVPQVAVAASRTVPTPQLRADVVGPIPSTEAPAVDIVAAVAATTTRSARELETQAGGDAPRPGQTGPPVEAAVGRGAAASPDGGPTPTGSPAPPRAPFRQELDRPFAVLVDNAAGYPQYGLRAASQVHEMPVEGGLTRLMLVFDRTDPERVGPVRSARDYFVELARTMDAVLVHDGGSPGAMASITTTNTPTLNSFSRGELFSRGDGRAPYNLFAGGDALRAAVNRIEVGRGRTVTGTIYRPDEEGVDATEVRVRYGGTYETGFRYEPGVNAYRWVRNGDGASDATGEAVLVDAVLVAAIEARVIPGDAEGRLYIPLRGGEATLFVRGKAVPGRWEVPAGQGVRFVTEEGGVDLAPFKTWVIFTPADERTEVRAPATVPLP